MATKKKREIVFSVTERKWFTVVLLYPNIDEPETYIDAARAIDAYAAVKRVQESASASNEGRIAAEDFIPVAVFRGNLDVELDVRNFPEGGSDAN